MIYKGTCLEAKLWQSTSPEYEKRNWKINLFVILTPSYGESSGPGNLTSNSYVLFSFTNYISNLPDIINFITSFSLLLLLAAKLFCCIFFTFLINNSGKDYFSFKILIILESIEFQVFFIDLGITPNKQKMIFIYIIYKNK